MSELNQEVMNNEETDRDALAAAAIGIMEEEQVQAAPVDDVEQFDAESIKQLLSYSLGIVELSVSAICDVPFEINTDAGNKWIDAAAPMVDKYGPAGLALFAKYQTEIMFAMATLSLVGGSAVQVRRLKAAKVILSDAAAEDAAHEAA